MPFRASNQTARGLGYSNASRPAVYTWGLAASQKRRNLATTRPARFLLIRARMRLGPLALARVAAAVLLAACSPDRAASLDGGGGGDDGASALADLAGVRDGAGAHDSAALDGATLDGGGPALNPTVAPGGNFDLTLWELQEPIGAPGAPTTISPAQLAGPNGFHDSYFFTDPVDGAMTFWDPENGVTTANSNYPRSELREMTAAGAPANWPTSGTHRLSATLAVTQVPSHVAVGQIHLGTGTPASTKPLLELFYYADGSISLGVEQSPAGGNEVLSPVGSAPLGTRWSYVIELSGNTITVIIDGGAPQTFAMSPTFNQENMYFKAGDYDQSVGSSATVGATVKLYALTIFHGP
jgi:hypothetical protein